MTSTLLIASRNAHKISEITPVLQQAGFDVTDARQHELPEPVEDSGSFIGNARIKAIAAVEVTGMAVVADDSGLVVDALGDFPGVETAPYTEETGGFPQAVADLHKRLNGRPATCHYVCILLVRFPDGEEIIAEGKVHGTLLTEPRGENGFGYDPWFRIDGRDVVFAEISDEEKTAISHRGLALRDLLRKLEERNELRAVS